MNYEFLQRNNLIPIFATVIFFSVVQTLFFYFIASSQFESVVISKIQWLKVLSQKNKTVRTALKRTINSNISELEEKSKKEKEKRESENILTTLRYCGIPIGIFTAIMIFIVFFMNTNEQWTKDNDLNLFFVLFSYTTEIFYFFFIVKRYEFVGDHYIIANTVKKMS